MQDSAYELVCVQKRRTKQKTFFPFAVDTLMYDNAKSGYAFYVKRKKVGMMLNLNDEKKSWNFKEKKYLFLSHEKTSFYHFH